MGLFIKLLRPKELLKRGINKKRNRMLDTSPTACYGSGAFLIPIIRYAQDKSTLRLDRLMVYVDLQFNRVLLSIKFYKSADLFFFEGINILASIVKILKSRPYLFSVF